MVLSDSDSTVFLVTGIRFCLIRNEVQNDYIYNVKGRNNWQKHGNLKKKHEIVLSVQEIAVSLHRNSQERHRARCFVDNELGA